MTKYFKLLGVALIATSLAFVSCGDEGEGTDPGTNPPVVDPEPEPEPEPEPNTVRLVFGDTSWTAAAVQGINYAEYGAIGLNAFSDTEGATFPQFQSGIMASAVGTYTDAITEQLSYGSGIVAWLEYYQSSYWTISGTAYGDWWAKEATINITAIDLTALKVSLNINATMFLFGDLVVDGQIDPTLLSNATTQSMTVAAVDVEMLTAKSALKR